MNWLNLELFPPEQNGFQVSKRPTNVRYKSSKPKSPKVSMPQLSKEGLQWEDRTYGTIEDMLSGDSLLGRGLLATQRAEAIEDYSAAAKEGKQTLESGLARTVNPNDTRVLQATRNMFESQTTSGRDMIEQQFRTQGAADKELGMDMAVDALANAKRMSASITQQYNSYLQQHTQSQQNYGTFGSQMMEGIGGALGWLNAGQRYANGMSGNVQTGSPQQKAMINSWGGMSNVANMSYGTFMG
ncbi:MAG: hypothetical protein LLF76_02720 [Planctomycetaceae bacterium]|nr:hypothetical protein [Planctomycetaceae bacterium]